MSENETSKLRQEYILDRQNIDPIDTHSRKTESQFIEKSANYAGSWTLVQKKRMEHESFWSKFEYWVELGASSLPIGKISPLSKYPNKEEYLLHLHEFDKTFVRLNSYVEYAEANSYECKPTNLGYSPGFGETAALFNDARYSKTNEHLSVRQKDIVVAHEIYHGLVSPHGRFAREVIRSFDFSAITKYNDSLSSQGMSEKMPPSYMNADELLARMAQLKNYFGMSGNEIFSKIHLDYARLNYVTDTSLDNNMGVFFEMIAPELEKKFILNMNSMPI